MWTNCTVQFARLIAELEAAGALTDEVMESVTASMSQEPKYVIDLKDRAVRLWEETLSHANPAAWIEEVMGSGALQSISPWQLITRAQAESWAGRPLSDEEMDRLDNAIPNSSIPDAINAIVANFNNLD